MRLDDFNVSNIKTVKNSYFLQLYNFINILARLNDLQIGINILKLTLI